MKPLDVLERAEQDYLRVNGWSRRLMTIDQPKSEQSWVAPDAELRLGHDDAVRVQKAKDREVKKAAHGSAGRG